MCLYSKLIRNRKYVANNKNGGDVPTPSDPRVQWVAVGCGNCIECRQQKARAWNIRLQEEIRHDRTGKFITLTFSNESIWKLKQEINEKLTGYEVDNAIAKLAVRRFLERWRKKHKKSVKHWLITELGQGKYWKYQGTENLHLHGFIFTENKEDIKNLWQYGFVYIGKYVSERTINYTTKYCTKTDNLHREYKPTILTSAGIGAKYTQRIDAEINKYSENGTNDKYRYNNGKEVNLPIYYRNKIYSEEEREKLWLEKLDKQERYVLGKKISIKKDFNEYYKTLEIARAKNERLGYGSNEKDEDRINYENTMREINNQKRLDIAEEKINFKEKLELIKQFEYEQIKQVSINKNRANRKHQC